MAGVSRQYGEPYQYGSEEKRMERLIFNRRPMWLVIIAILTCYFAFEMTRIKMMRDLKKCCPCSMNICKTCLAGWKISRETSFHLEDCD